MSAKISLVILKSGESFKRLYHAGLTDPINTYGSSLLWSHPSIMSSHIFQFTDNTGPIKFRGGCYSLNDLLERGQSNFNMYQGVETYPHVRLEVTGERGGDPLDLNIPEDKIYQQLEFRFDNPTRSFGVAGCSKLMGMGDMDDERIAMLIDNGTLPSQPWAVKQLRRIQSEVVKDIRDMRAGTWTNPPFLLEYLDKELYPKRVATVPTLIPGSQIDSNLKSLTKWATSPDGKNLQRALTKKNMEIMLKSMENPNVTIYEEVNLNNRSYCSYVLSKEKKEIWQFILGDISGHSGVASELSAQVKHKVLLTSAPSHVKRKLSNAPL